MIVSNAKGIHLGVSVTLEYVTGLVRGVAGKRGWIYQ